MSRKAIADRMSYTPSRVRRAGEVKMEYVFGAALAVIIVGAMVLALVFGFGRPEQTVVEGARYECQSCGEQFTVEDQPPKTPDQIGPGRVDCPKCGAVQSGILMVKCPGCGEYFVPETYKRPEDVLKGIPIKNICPHCGLDLGEWRKQERERIRRERGG